MKKAGAAAAASAALCAYASGMMFLFPGGLGAFEATIALVLRPAPFRFSPACSGICALSLVCAPSRNRPAEPVHSAPLTHEVSP